MRNLLKRYKIDGIWHFTDRSNVALIKQHRGLLSLGELERRNIVIPATGGNQWSHDADKIRGVHEFVHLSFLDYHPMLFHAKQRGGINDPIWIKVDPSILLEDGVRFTEEVSNKSGVSLLTAEEALDRIDFEVLFTYMDWRDPVIRARRNAALKSEILVPQFVPIEKILGKRDG